MDIRRAGMVIIGLCLVMACASRHTSISAQGTVPSAPDATGSSPQPPGTHAIVFGVGSPVLSAERSGTSIGIAVGGTLYLFDAGPGIERRIMESHAQLLTLGIRTLGPVFITHLHQDHTTGLAALLAYHTFGSAPQLVLIGPGDRIPLTV